MQLIVNKKNKILFINSTVGIGRERARRSRADGVFFFFPVGK